MPRGEPAAGSGKNLAFYSSYENTTTIRRVLCRSGVLLTLGGALPALGVTALAASTPPQRSVDCDEWQQRHEGTDPADTPCVARRTFRAEEDLSDLRREEEKGAFRWHTLEPSGRDLSLWYYRGAPRPLWGY